MEANHGATAGFGEYGLRLSRCDRNLDHAVGAPSPAFDQATAVEDLGDVRVSRSGRVDGLEVVGRETEWQGAVAPDLHPVIKDGDADRAAGDARSGECEPRIVPAEERSWWSPPDDVGVDIQAGPFLGSGQGSETGVSRVVGGKKCLLAMQDGRVRSVSVVLALGATRSSRVSRWR
jgi:hypothetical protein